MEKELECKVFTDDFNGLMDKAIEMGAKMIAHEIQENILIESNNFDLIDSSDYLRIRISKDIFNNENKKFLTYKKRVNDTNVRHYDEYTIEFDSEENLKQILKFVKLDKQSSSKKERKSFEFMDARLDFDCWDKDFYPYPYLEIEVKDEEHLNEIINKLGINKDQISTESISELISKLQES